MLPFEFESPVVFFAKADAAPGKQRRIGGLISTEVTDRQGEVLLQRGLDFSDFIKNGWYNDNHSKATTDVLGYPESVRRFTKGEQLPDGSKAETNCTWSEGYLLDTSKANAVWELGQALQKTGRRLGFSVEGRIDKRQGPNNRIIARALVRNVAITNCPVNDGTRLEILAKSLASVERSEPEFLEKMLGMGTSTPGVAPVGPQTGMGAGQVLARESLEGQRNLDLPTKKKKRVVKSLSQPEAIAWVRQRVPSLDATGAARLVALTKALKRQGRI